jgi:hypothetical protein
MAIDKEMWNDALAGANVCEKLLQALGASVCEGRNTLVGALINMDHFAEVDIVGIACDFPEQSEG